MQFEADDAVDRDRQWIARIRRGDHAALTEVYAEYGVRLCAYAHRWTRSREAAEEIVQDVFLGLWRAREEWQFSGPVNAYLFRAVRNRVANHLRRDRVALRFQERALATEERFGAGTGHGAPDDAVTQDELRASVQAAVAALPDRCREVFLLNREQGLTYAEIAQLQSVTVKTVEYHMGRAFAALRKGLAAWSPAGVARSA